MKLNRSLKAGILLIFMLFSMAVPAACAGGAGVIVHCPEKFNTGESYIRVVEACESVEMHKGKALSGEGPALFTNFSGFGWPPITVRVDGNGGGTFLTIEEALQYAFAGETILVAPGTYTENLLVDSQVTLRAESGAPGDTVIRAKDPKVPVFHVTGRNVEIRGFTVEGANGSNAPENGSGIFLDGAWHCTLEANVFRNNSCAVFLKDSEGCSLKNNSVEQENNYGILLEGAEGNLLENHDIRVEVFDSGNVSVLDETYEPAPCKKISPPIPFRFLVPPGFGDEAYTFKVTLEDRFTETYSTKVHTWNTVEIVIYEEEDRPISISEWNI